MIKQQKIILYLILINALNILYSCTETHYIKNKYRITGCEAIRIDSSKIHLKFDVVYYSDSSQNNLFPSSIEKGLDGSDNEILFLGYETPKFENKNFKELITNINLNKRGFKGEKLEKGYLIDNINFLNERFILVIKKKYARDTIIVSIDSVSR